MELHDIWAYGHWQDRYAGKEIKCSPVAYASMAGIRARSRKNICDSTGTFDRDFKEISPGNLPLRFFDSMRYEQSRVMLTYGGRLYARYSKSYGRFFEMDGSVEAKGTVNTIVDTISKMLYKP
ncbi:MAG: hypothetical protein JXA71_14060 [Chitinispirillaceae bacterium]|nr:hypothetical protein [Chitinispirillaceae bacterium]